MPSILEEPTVELTPEEQTRSKLEEWSKRWMGEKEPAEKKQKPEPAEPEAEPEAEVAPVVEPVVEEVKPPTVDPEIFAQAVGREVGKVLRESNEPKAVVEPVKEEKGLPESELRRQKNMEVLETLFPEQYKNISKERSEYLDKQRKYEEKWIADNEGTEFNPDDSEHDEFFASDPINKVESEHLAEAISEQRVVAERARWDQRIAESEARTRVIPMALKEGRAIAAKVAQTISGTEMSSIIGADGELNQEKIAEMTEADPITAPIIIHAARVASQLGNEVVKLFNGATALDSNNQLHKNIVNFGVAIEGKMQQIKPEQWHDSRGRQHADFLPSTQFHNLPADQKSKHWTFDQKDMIELMALDLVSDAKKIISQEEKKMETFAKKRGYETATTKKAVEVKSFQSRSFAMEPDVQQVSPSSSTEPKMAGVKGNPKTNAEKLQDAWADRWMGR